MTGRASSSMIFLILQALCFRLKKPELPGVNEWTIQISIPYPIQCTKNMRYHRFEPGYLSERENKNRKIPPFSGGTTGYLIDD